MAVNPKHGPGALRRYAGGTAGSYDTTHGVPDGTPGANDAYEDAADGVSRPSGETAPNTIPNPAQVGGK